MDLDLNSGIFITLNPAGKGYGGRQKLPDNLKQLFRPVVMSVPNNELIAEVLLFAEGFREGKSLGRKLVAIFTLSKFVIFSCFISSLFVIRFLTFCMQVVKLRMRIE